MIVLENDNLYAEINFIGAELVVLQQKGKENVLWNPDLAFWNRTAPNLFPIVGRLVNDRYQYKDCTYELKQHGFARDLPFTIRAKTKSHVELQLTENEETRKKYPFSFEFVVMYELFEDRIEISYKTSNNNEIKMPYSVGGHPGFALNLPLDNYRLNFHSSFETDRWLIEKGYYSGQKHSMKIDCLLNLKDEYFTSDAIVFKHPKFMKVTLEKINAEQVVTVGSSSWEAIGFWTKQNAPFFCIEPWWGWADSHDSTGNIENKAGLHWLEPGQEEMVSFFIQVH